MKLVREFFCSHAVSVILFSTFGAILRLLIADASNRYNNVLGCFIIGLLFEVQEYIIPTLYVGLTVGLCGSLTSFSGWLVFAADNILGKTVDALVGFLLSFCANWVSFRVGTHFSAIAEANKGKCVGSSVGDGFYASTCSSLYSLPSRNVEMEDEEHQSQTEQSEYPISPLCISGPLAVPPPPPPSIIDSLRTTHHPPCIQESARPSVCTFTVWSRSDQCFLAFCTVTLCVSLIWLCLWILDNNKERVGKLWIPLLMSPIGAFARFKISKLNKIRLFAWFPLGTLLSNLIATTGSAIVQAYHQKHYQGTQEHHWEEVLRNGLLASLSTVSTFIVELEVISSDCLVRAYIYGFSSVLLTLPVAISIIAMFRYI